MIVLPIVRIAAANRSDPQRPISTPLNIQSMTMSARVLIPQRTRSATHLIIFSLLVDSPLKIFWSFMAAPMSPLIFSLPVM